MLHSMNSTPRAALTVFAYIRSRGTGMRPALSSIANQCASSRSSIPVITPLSSMMSRTMGEERYSSSRKIPRGFPIRRAVICRDNTAPSVSHVKAISSLPTGSGTVRTFPSKYLLVSSLTSPLITPVAGIHIRFPASSNPCSLNRIHAVFPISLLASSISSMPGI